MVLYNVYNISKLIFVILKKKSTENSKVKLKQITVL